MVGRSCGDEDGSLGCKINDGGYHRWVCWGGEASFWVGGREKEGVGWV